MLAEAASRLDRAKGEKWQLRFFLDGEAIEPSPELLPRLEDRTLDGYAARMEEACPGRGYAILLSDYHRLRVEHWRRLRDFFGSFFSEAGLPPGGTVADIFVGNDARTPLGVHRDTLSVFTSVVTGRKRLLVWPAHVFEGVDPRTVDYSKYLDDATLLEGEAGDLFYWPSSHWHIAESSGGLTATLALGEFRDSAQAVVHDDMARYVAGGRARTKGPADVASARIRSGLAQTLPDGLRLASENLSEQLRRRVVTRWVERLSNHGLSPPPLRHDELAVDDTILCPSRHPIVMLADGPTLLLGACGRALPVPAFPQLVALVEELNAGAPARVDALLGRHSGERSADGADPFVVEADALLEVLRTLYSFWAFDKH